MGIRLLKILLVGLLFSLPSPLAPLLSGKTLTMKDGLAGESVYKIYQDRYGIIWFATDNGVSCWDGWKMKSYMMSDVRSKNHINDIIVADDQHIWVAANSGLYYSDGSDEGFRLASNELQENVTSVKVAPKSSREIYAGTANGLYIVDEDHKTQHFWVTGNHMSKKMNSIKDIEIDSKGRIWILTTTELFLFNSKTKKFTPTGISKQLIVHNGLRNMTVAGDLIIIGSYNDGLFSYNIRTHAAKSYTNVNCQVITCLSNDGKNIYVGTDGEGLWVLSLSSGKVVQKFESSSGSTAVQSGSTVTTGLLDNTVYSFYKDKEGVCFFGYYRRGAQYEYRTIPLFHCYKYGWLDSRNINVRSFCVDDRVKLLGTRNGLYYVNEGTGVIKYFSSLELGGSIVTNVTKYDGNYYCSTFNGGVTMLNARTLKVSRFGKNDVLRIGSFGKLVVHDDELWMAGNAGVIVYNSKTGEERIYNAQNSQLYGGYVNDIFWDRQGRGWISSANGICIYDPVDKTIRANGFPQGFFNRMAETTGTLGDKDNLLFTCQDGIFKTNEELTEFGPIDTKEIIGNFYTPQAWYDSRQKHYWLGTEKGMYRFDSEFHHPTLISQKLGLDSREFSNGALFIDDDRTIWTATANGLYYGNVDYIDNYRFRDINIILSDVKINHKEIGTEYNIRLMNDHTIHLTYNWETDVLTFIPVFLDYSDPDGTSFEYRFGLNGDWKLLKNTDCLSTQDELHWGKNILQIRLAGQEEAEEYTIYVWPSSWFVFQMVLLGIVLAIVFFYYRQRLITAAQREQMEQVRQELEETKKKYNRVNVNQDKQQRLYHLLDNYLREEKAYLNTDLKLSDIASRLACSTVKLSQLLNVFLQTNYYDFINKYRLEEFKERYKDKRYANYTLMALAEECGFKRSSFFSTFKKIEGKTPNEWAKAPNP